MKEVGANENVSHEKNMKMCFSFSERMNNYMLIAEENFFRALIN